MTDHAIGHGTVRVAIELACRAPSVLNTQPWQWRLEGPRLHLFADRTRQLPGSDPGGRELRLSCGAALHHARVALGALDVIAVVYRLPDPRDPDHLAVLELHTGVGRSDPGLVDAIARRRTDRRAFSARPVPPDLLGELAVAASDQGASLRGVPDPALRDTLLDAIALADRLAADDPARVFEAELWSGRFAGTDGVPPAAVAAAGRGGVSDPFPPGRPAAETARASSDAGAPGRHDAGQHDAGQHDAGQHDGAELIVIGTSSDDARSHLRAGEAASAVLLRATELGLAGEPLSRVLEFGATRDLVADQVLDGTLCPQLVVRVGWAPDGAGPPPPTPRRPVDEMLVIDDDQG